MLDKYNDDSIMPFELVLCRLHLSIYDPYIPIRMLKYCGTMHSFYLKDTMDLVARNRSQLSDWFLRLTNETIWTKSSSSQLNHTCFFSKKSQLNHTPFPIISPFGE